MGETPLHKAARTGSMECVSLLVSQGAKLKLVLHHISSIYTYLHVHAFSSQMN